MRAIRIAVGIVSLSGSLVWGQTPQTAPPAQPARPAVNTAIVAAPRTEKWWQDRHEQALARNKEGPVDVVFIGDSITQGWEGAGKEAWEKNFAPLHAANLGFSGDRTQHVLWRLDHGEVDGIHPKAAVIMIGTNNSNGADYSAAEIADGIKAVVAKLRAKQPETNVLLLGVFPRGEKPNPQREKLEQVNSSIAGLDNGKDVFYLDIAASFLQPDSSISKEIMPDFLHLSPKGYELWAAAVGPRLHEMLGRK